MRRWLYLLCLGLTLTMSSCSPACLSTSLAQIHDPAGITFTVTRTDCDTIAKDSAILITATRDNERGSTLLLKYEPWTDEVPQVYVAEGGAIFIHVAKASSILEKHLTWGALKVNITIDKLAYPDDRGLSDRQWPNRINSAARYERQPFGVLFSTAPGHSQITVHGYLPRSCGRKET